jgi:hypothetical protein
MRPACGTPTGEKATETTVAPVTTAALVTIADTGTTAGRIRHWAVKVGAHTPAESLRYAPKVIFSRT